MDTRTRIGLLLLLIVVFLNTTQYHNPPLHLLFLVGAVMFGIPEWKVKKVE